MPSHPNALQYVLRIIVELTGMQTIQYEVRDVHTIHHLIAQITQAPDLLALRSTEKTGVL